MTGIAAPLAVRCALCGRDDAKPLYRPRLSPGPVVRCRGCGLVYVNPIEHPERLAEAVRDGERPASAEPEDYRSLYLAERGVKRRAYVAALERLERAAGTRGALLDVGSYMGLFLEAAAERGWQGRGVEPDRAARAHAVESLGLDVALGTLDTCALDPAAFDAVTLLQVLEHVRDPRRALRQVHDLLRPGGVVLVEVPNIACAPVRLLGRRHRHFARHHFTFFTPATLGALLTACGFEVAERWFPGRHISLRLMEFALRTWHPRVHRAVAPVLRRPRLAGRVLTVNLHEVLAVCARKPRAA